MAKLGIDSVFYRNSASHGSPSWEACDGLSDFTPNENWTVADILIRRSRVKFGAKTELDIGFSGKLLKEPGDENYEAILDALRSPDGTLDLLILDGPIDVVGSVGIRADFQITTGTGSQNPGDVLYMDIAGVPYPTSNAPQYAEVGDGAVLAYTDI